MVVTWFMLGLRQLRRIRIALTVAMEYGSIDGAHHKAWVIDQMVRALVGAYYSQWLIEHNRGEDGPDSYSWDEGIAP